MVKANFRGFDVLFRWNRQRQQRSDQLPTPSEVRGPGRVKDARVQPIVQETEQRGGINYRASLPLMTGGGA